MLFEMFESSSSWGWLRLYVRRTAHLIHVRYNVHHFSQREQQQRAFLVFISFSIEFESRIPSPTIMDINYWIEFSTTNSQRELQIRFLSFYFRMLFDCYGHFKYPFIFCSQWIVYGNDFKLKCLIASFKLRKSLR